MFATQSGLHLEASPGHPPVSRPPVRTAVRRDQEDTQCRDHLPPVSRPPPPPLSGLRCSRESVALDGRPGPVRVAVRRLELLLIRRRLCHHHLVLHAVLRCRERNLRSVSTVYWDTRSCSKRIRTVTQSVKLGMNKLCENTEV